MQERCLFDVEGSRAPLLQIDSECVPRSGVGTRLRLVELSDLEGECVQTIGIIK